MTLKDKLVNLTEEAKKRDYTKANIIVDQQYEKITKKLIEVAKKGKSEIYLNTISGYHKESFSIKNEIKNKIIDKLRNEKLVVSYLSTGYNITIRW